MASRVIDLCRKVSGLPSNNSSIVDALKSELNGIKKKHAVGSAKLRPVVSATGDVQCYSLVLKLIKSGIESIELERFSCYKVTISGESLNISYSGPLISTANSYFSHSGDFWCVIPEISDDSDGQSDQNNRDVATIELWSRKRGPLTLIGKQRRSFGKAMHFKCSESICWSQDDTKLAIITDGYDGKDGKDEAKESEKDVVPEGLADKYLFRKDWTEQLVDSYHPILLIVDVVDDFKIRKIDIPEISCAEPFWINNKTIGFVGYQEKSRLGLFSCPIRQSCLYTCDLSNPNSEPIAVFNQDFNLAIRSPRVNGNGTKIVFLANEPCGPHFQASSLMVLDIKSSQVATLIDAKSSKITPDVDPKEIGSLYTLSLPQRCWTCDDKKLIVSTDSSLHSHIFLVDVESGKSQSLSINGSESRSSSSILDIRDDILVLNVTSPTMGSNIVIGKLHDNKLGQLIPVAPEYIVAHNDLEFRSDIIPVELSPDNQQSISCILIGPKDSFNTPSPTILIPHGGPHGAFSVNYMPRVALMASVGFKVICVNYRGSTGVNSDYERLLCGKVGKTDVADCMAALNYYINQNQVDKDQVCLLGASHGGFLVTHLIGQHSDFGFRACCALNPVTDLSVGFRAYCALNPVTDLSVGLSPSEIPDWHLVEGCGSVESDHLNTIPIPDLLGDLLSKSPITHVDKVKTPTLMLLDMKDLRVTMCQGMFYYNALKARGATTKCLVYEDNHDIYKKKCGFDLTIDCLLWFLDNLVPK